MPIHSNQTEEKCQKKNEKFLKKFID